MIVLIGKLQRALARHGVKVELTTVAQVLCTLEDDGITLAPVQLSPQLHELAMQHAKHAKQLGLDPLNAAWAEITAHAIPELRNTLAARQAGAERATVDLVNAGELSA